LAAQGSSTDVVLSLVNLQGDVMATVATGTNAVTATFAQTDLAGTSLKKRSGLSTTTPST